MVRGQTRHKHIFSEKNPGKYVFLSKSFLKTFSSPYINLFQNKNISFSKLFSKAKSFS